MKSASYRIKKMVVNIALIILAVVCLFPLLVMMANATRTGTEIMKGFSIIPGSALQENWNTMSSYLNIFRGLANSLFVAVASTVLSAYFSSITAYAFAVYQFHGSRLIFTVILVVMMVPGQLGLLGFYDLVNALGLLDSYVPLIIPAIASPATVFFLRQYTATALPYALLEATRIDGASEIYTFHKIALPIMAPGIATMCIGLFIGSWNNYLMPLILLMTKEKFTLPVMVASMSASQDITANQGAIYLTVAISVLPIIIAFCFCSRYIVGSISTGGVKE